MNEYDILNNLGGGGRGAEFRNKNFIYVFVCVPGDVNSGTGSVDNLPTLTKTNASKSEVNKGLSVKLMQGT